MGVRRRSGVILGVAAAALLCVGAPAQARPHAIVRSTARITSFGQSQSTLAWRTHASAEIRLKDLRTGTQASFAMFPTPTDPTVCIVRRGGVFVRGIAVGNTRAIWRWNAFADGCGGGDAVTFHAVSTVAINDQRPSASTTVAQSPRSTRRTRCTSARSTHGGSLSAFSTVHQGCPGRYRDPGAVTIFDGTHQFSSPFAAAARLSVARTDRLDRCFCCAELTILGGPSASHRSRRTRRSKSTTRKALQRDCHRHAGRHRTVDRTRRRTPRRAGSPCLSNKVIIRYRISDRGSDRRREHRARAAARSAWLQQILYTVGHRVDAIDATTGRKRLVATTSVRRLPRRSPVAASPG